MMLPLRYLRTTFKCPANAKAYGSSGMRRAIQVCASGDTSSITRKPGNTAASEKALLSEVKRSDRQYMVRLTLVHLTDLQT